MAKKHLFIHIPKNAGSAVKYFLKGHIAHVNESNLDQDYKKQLLKTFTGPTSDHSGNSPNYTHARWRDLSEEVKEKYIPIAIIRNPWDKVVSRYCYRNINHKLFGTYDKKTFEEFLEERFIDGNKQHYWHRAIQGWYPQKDHVTDVNGNLICDIMRYEYLNQDLADYFNKELKVKWKNVSNGDMQQDRSKVDKRKDYKKFYTEETKQIIADWYKDDIEFFGFTFDGPATKNIWKK